ncbi:MAG TPA: hypothetical protein PLS90_00470 [Candidatus Sumerlaeota bacterium]|nr:hypothetical protein [Candidatus Sumerlaeota bacterium]HPK00905.1 hypothetical protein [Candidatus Sumerlaeota bacterium]
MNDGSLDAPGGPATRRAAALSALLIFVAALAAFEPALFNSFAHDDAEQVGAWPLPAGAGDWLRVPLQPWWPLDRLKHEWRPLTRLTILAQKAAAGETTWPYYALNLLLHGAVSVLLLGAARACGMPRRAALAGALIFAAHPIHAEAVHQVVGRAETLAAGWMLLGLWLHARRPGSAHALWQQPLCYALALGSKDHAILYPVYLGLAAAARGWGGTHPAGGSRGIIGRRRALLTLALLAVGGTYLVLRARITGGLAAAPGEIPFHENPLARATFAARWPAVLGIFGYAASRLVYPLGLSPDYSAYSLPIERGWGWGWTWIGLLILAGLVGGALRCARQGSGRGAAWLVLGGLAAWGLTSNAAFPIGVITAERLWYWPSAAGCLGLGWLAAAGLGRAERRLPRLFGYGLALIVVLLCAASWHYAGAWRSQAAYAEWTVARFPASWRGHVNLAREAYQTREFERGAAEARIATRLLPGEEMGWVWLGLNATFLPARRAEAEAALRRALELKPALASVHRNLGNLYQLQGREAEAAEQFRIYLDSPEAADREAIQERLRSLEGG